MTLINFIIFSITFSSYLYEVSAWQQSNNIHLHNSKSYNPSRIQPRTWSSHLQDSTSLSSEANDAIGENGEKEKTCYYKVGDKWKPRIKLDELSIGQKLIGEKIRNADLLNAKTGPKIFFECGIGRIDKKGNWQMVSGMYRVAKSYSKPKVVKKKVDRLTGKEVELYVSKIRLSQGKLEVCASLEEYEREMEKMKDRGEVVSASTLNVGQEIIGNVVDVRPYGVIVDVGANRNGLFHIQAVADLYGKFINKEDGLMEAGLERGAKVKLCVKSNEKKRLFLDFTEETKDLANAQIKEKEITTKDVEESDVSVKRTESQEDMVTDEKKDDDGVDPYYDEAAAWAAYYDNEEVYEEEEDEDRDIEDALGIGYY